MVPSAIVWKWFFSPGTVGLANYLLNQMGLPMVGWMSDPKITLLATIWIHVWKNIGFFVIIFLVGLKNVPQDFRDAAAVDGANVWQATWHVDLPLLKPIILFGTVMATIWAWSAFTEVYIMTHNRISRPPAKTCSVTSDIALSISRVGLCSGAPKRVRHSQRRMNHRIFVFLRDWKIPGISKIIAIPDNNQCHQLVRICFQKAVHVQIGGI